MTEKRPRFRHIEITASVFDRPRTYCSDRDDHHYTPADLLSLFTGEDHELYGDLSDTYLLRRIRREVVELARERNDLAGRCNKLAELEHDLKVARARAADLEHTFRLITVGRERAKGNERAN